MKIIKLTKDLYANCWIADYIGDAEVLAAFGTTKIPTAFTANADKIEVKEAIQQLNPAHTVLTGSWTSDDGRYQIYDDLSGKQYVMSATQNGVIIEIR